MNPNSANQRWSRWTITIVPGRQLMRTQAEVQENVSRFLRKMFGSASEACITGNERSLVIDVRTEGHPAHDPTYVAYFASALQKFFISGFGVGTQVTTRARLEAGSAQDGTPPSQLLILPALIGVNHIG